MYWTDIENSISLRVDGNKNSGMLYDVISNKRREIDGITDNPTLKVFDDDLCKILDDLAVKDPFVEDCINKAIKELELADVIDYSSHYRSAYGHYCEAVCYYMLQKKGFTLKKIPESSAPTPDFEVNFTIKDWTGRDIPKSVFLEVKSLSFADGILQYQKAQQASLDMHIRIEESLKRGNRVGSGFYEVSPLGYKNIDYTSGIEILITKINQNIKEDQYHYEEGKDTILFVDLSQFAISFKMCECLPVYPDMNKKCSVSGRLWMIAFGRMNERIYDRTESFAKKNLNRDLQQEGILERYKFIKGIIFSSGVKQEEKRLYGLYRFEDQDTDTVKFMGEVCDFVNDDKNSWGFEYFDSLVKSLFAKREASKTSEDPISTNKSR